MGSSSEGPSGSVRMAAPRPLRHAPHTLRGPMRTIREISVEDKGGRKGLRGPPHNFNTARIKLVCGSREQCR
eukprot:6955328-Pyramimonas_sp.AAC.1